MPSPLSLKLTEEDHFFVTGADVWEAKQRAQDSENLFETASDAYEAHDYFDKQERDIEVFEFNRHVVVEFVEPPYKKK